jgi:hypothetical protein
MPYPQELGLPCWTRDNVPKVISLTAQTSASSAAHFLAAHSPFRRIADAKSSGRTLTEEEVFNDVFSKARRQVQAFVKGEPGTGKSHLIRWLKLRSDYAAEHREQGMEQFRFVLVSRGNGSLKDALGQIVVQLGKEFAPHIADVHSAIDKLSQATARAMLLSQLALELDTRWTNEHGRPSLDRALRHFGQALRANGFGRWLKRDGGLIHQRIQLLTEPSTVDQREAPPLFTPEELYVPETYLTPAENPGQVIEFAEDLKEDTETLELAVQTLNTALNDAISGLTGLTGSDLLKIFNKIRRQLGPKRALAVFIEDVSVTGLDQDVVNAFEPRDDSDLCKMVAVLGITSNAWDRMPDNLRQRATNVFEVGGDTVNDWVANVEDVTKFAARYLNAVRLGDKEIHEVAQERFDGDITRSHCEMCPARVECHEVFGKVDFPNSVTVGLFPFTTAAPHAMLQRLSEARYKSQRGLLDRILLPALDQSFDSLVQREFPHFQLFAVTPPSLLLWPGFVNRYCNGARWDDVAKSRLRFLAHFWVGGGSADELASALKPFLQPLGLPAFSAAAASPPKKDGKPVPPPSDKPLPVSNPQLERLIALLDAWRDGQQLKEDNKFRDLLGELLNRSIRWQDHRQIPISEKKRLLKGNMFPHIDGQTMNPRSSYLFSFNRDADTYSLLHSLLLFSYAPQKTWDFEHGELHKREVSRWLRKHRARAIESIQPDPPSLTQGVLRPTVEALALLAILRDRRNFPEDRAGRISSLLAPAWDESAKPVILSSDLQAVANDLQQKYLSLRDLIVQELGAGQGDAKPTDFLDPLPLLALLEAFEKKMDFHPPPSEAEQSYWGPRFTAVRTLARGAFATIPSRIQNEREAIAKAAQAGPDFVKKAGSEEFDTHKAFENCLEELTEVIGLQRGTQHKKAILPLPNESFDQLWQRKLLQTSDTRISWANALAKAGELAKEKDPATLLAFNPARLQEAIYALKVIEAHLDLLDKHLSDEEEQGGADGDSRPKLLAALNGIEQLADTKESQPN